MLMPNLPRTRLCGKVILTVYSSISSVCGFSRVRVAYEKLLVIIGGETMANSSSALRLSSERKTTSWIWIGEACSNEHQLVRGTRWILSGTTGLESRLKIRSFAVMCAQEQRFALAEGLRFAHAESYICKFQQARVAGRPGMNAP